MKNIEKSLINFINGKDKMISKEQIKYHSERDINGFINSLFFVINYTIDNSKNRSSSFPTDKIIIIFNLIKTSIMNSDIVDRKIVNHKLCNLNSKLNRLLIERKKGLVKSHISTKNVKKIRESINGISNYLNNRSSNQYELIDYIINIKNLYLADYILKRVPKLINIRDKDGLHIYTKCIIKYIESIKKENEDDIMYYNSILSLLSSKKDFQLQKIDQSNIIRIIYTEIDNLCVPKKDKKKNKHKITLLKELIETIKESRINNKENIFEITTKKHNIEPYFSNFINDEAQRSKLIRKEVIGTMVDREFIGDYTITIDKKKALELDDALSCTHLENGNYLLKVSINSVLGHYPYESEIVQTAISRGCSIYLPIKYKSKDNELLNIIPLFPFEFSENIASFLPGEERLARTYIFEIDNDGNIVRESFIKSVIQSNKKTTYDEIDDIIKNGTEDKSLQELVDNLVAVTNILEKKYKPKKLYEKIKESQDDYSDLRVTQKGAEKIVYQAMLLTNHRVAKFFRNNNYPCLYRVHEVSEENSEKIERLLNNCEKVYDKEQYKKLKQLLTGIYPRGRYDIEGSHYGLDLDACTHITSCSRRAADIVVEHCLQVCYDKKPTPEELKQLEKEVLEKRDIINAQNNRIDCFITDYKNSYQKR